MSGWMIVFALLTTAGGAPAMAGYSGIAAKLASVVFAILFLAAATARATRGRTW